MIAGAIDTVQPLIAERRHALAVDLPPEPLIVDADATRLSQVFSNLLNNAAKYTEPGGCIAIRANADAHEACVSIRDNGIGIAPDMLDAVFGMFAQADASLERVHGGLGVGLTLAQHLVELHGGSIEAASEGIGRGSEFVGHIPRPSDARPMAGSTGMAFAARCSTRRV